MIIRRSRINLCLLSAMAAAIVCGCQTEDDRKAKQIATLRVHLETIQQSMDFSTTVEIYRAHPVPVTVDKSPFLTEANVEEAKVVDVPGGFDLQIKFDRRGTWLFEEFTTTNPGKHFAVFSAFPDRKGNQGRWLGAPIIKGRISNGILAFAPDVTREEAEEIARCLNNGARKNREAPKW